jgi:hypothetical protein
VPDHSTFSKNRHGRFRDSDLLRELFETTVARCMAEGLVGGEGFAVDASMIKADANRQRSVPGSEGLSAEAAGPCRARVSRGAGRCGVRRRDAGHTQVHLRCRSGIPLDGSQRRIGLLRQFTNYLIDLKHAVIMDVEAITAVRQAEVTAQRVMLDRTQERFGLGPERLAADSGYGDAANLAWLVHERGIEPHIPVFEKSRTDGSFGHDEFIYDHQRDSYSCPGGKQLRQFWQAGREAKSKPPTDGLYRYRARKADCEGCSLRERCRSGDAGRKVLRSVREGARDLARDLSNTNAYATSPRERKKVEMLFAHLKCILKLDRLRQRSQRCQG